MADFTNKSIVITGSGSGIGKATAILFAHHNATVHIIEVNEKHGEETAEEIRRANGNAFVHICDISKQQQVADTFKIIGAVNILINNAGVSHIGKADTTSEQDFDRIFQ